MADVVFPDNANTKSGQDNIAIQLFGDRLFSDQALYEYINEFLLVFVSPKGSDHEEDKMSFHTSFDNNSVYYVKPRMGLKRFIFYERSKKDVKIPADEKAYSDMIKVISETIGDGSADRSKIHKSVESIQDLLYGYATVLKNRSWTAKSLLPIAPELIFCEAMIDAKKRLVMHKTNADATDIEMGFDFSRHNFMARGGEVYYLHILQGLKLCSEEDRIYLEKLLINLISANSKCFSSLANWIDESWIKSQDINPDKLWIKKTLGFIPATGYIDCGRRTIRELITFLSNEMHPITRIEILAKGIVFQIMRMMCARASEYLEMKPLPWIIDMRGKKSGNTVMKISAQSYRRVEEMFVCAVNKRSAEHIKKLEELGQKPRSSFEYLSRAKSHTLNMFKRLGKEMQCIIPLKGGYERFSLSEELLKFLVLSFVKPQEKMTFTMFLDKLYLHFNIVIGPRQYKECINDTNLDPVQANAFNNNQMEFQNFLKATGFLRDLSDATAIVVNPYAEVEIS